MQYPVQSASNVTWFDTMDTNGITEVMFYAQETGVNTGVFQLNLNSILDDLGFVSLRVRDTLIAYYLDPNDEDDFQVGAAYIEAKENSITSFTDATRQDKELYWIGRDPVYVQVIDSNANVDPCCPEQVVVHICDPHEWDDTEWLILDETSSNSPVFFSNAGTELDPVWDAMGVGITPAHHGRLPAASSTTGSSRSTTRTTSTFSTTTCTTRPTRRARAASATSRADDVGHGVPAADRPRAGRERRVVRPDGDRGHAGVQRPDGQHVLPRPAGQPSERLRELGLRVHRGRRPGPERRRPAPRAHRRVLGRSAEQPVRPAGPEHVPVQLDARRTSTR